MKCELATKFSPFNAWPLACQPSWSVSPQCLAHPAPSGLLRALWANRQTSSCKTHKKHDSWLLYMMWPFVCSITSFLGSPYVAMKQYVKMMLQANKACCCEWAFGGILVAWFLFALVKLAMWRDMYSWQDRSYWHDKYYYSRVTRQIWAQCKHGENNLRSSNSTTSSTNRVCTASECMFDRMIMTLLLDAKRWL